MKPKLYIGPMSKNVVDSAIEFSNENNIPLGFCVSRRQVEFDGGYVNGWNTKEFSQYVYSKSSNITLVRDHGGPGQGAEYDNGVVSFENDVDCFNIIHIDPWKVYKSIGDAVLSTGGYIKICEENNYNGFYEVGTEQSIREMTPDDLFYFLTQLRDYIGYGLFTKVLYAVIQSGTSLQENENTGEYDKTKLKEMLNVCEHFSVFSKEHNGDYLDSSLIKEKISLGLDSINIAPEFGSIETKCVLDRIGDNNKLIDRFHNICFESGKWRKWVGDGFDPFKDKKKLITICGHYVFSYDSFKDMIKDSVFDGINDDIKNKIKKRIQEIVL